MTTGIYLIIANYGRQGMQRRAVVVAQSKANAERLFTDHLGKNVRMSDMTTEFIGTGLQYAAEKVLVGARFLDTGVQTPY